MHNNHLDTHTHGFADDCPRCQAYGDMPTGGVDAENIRRLWRGEIHTKTDMKVYNKLYAAAVLAQRIEAAFAYEGVALCDPAPTRPYGIDLFKVGGKA